MQLLQPQVGIPPQSFHELGSCVVCCDFAPLTPEMVMHDDGGAVLLTSWYDQQFARITATMPTRIEEAMTLVFITELLLLRVVLVDSLVTLHQQMS